MTKTFHSPMRKRRYLKKEEKDQGKKREKKRNMRRNMRRRREKKKHEREVWQKGSINYNEVIHV